MWKRHLGQWLVKCVENISRKKWTLQNTFKNSMEFVLILSERFKNSLYILQNWKVYLIASFPRSPGLLETFDILLCHPWHLIGPGYWVQDWESLHRVLQNSWLPPSLYYGAHSFFLFFCRTQGGPAYTWLFNFHTFVRPSVRPSVSKIKSWSLHIH